MQLLYIHDKALGSNHPIFSRINAETKAVFIWDDAYFKQRGYSLKRLVFIYETLCSMPVDIIYGTTSDVIKTIAPTKIITSFTADTPIQNISPNSLNLSLCINRALARLMTALSLSVFLNIGIRQKRLPLEGMASEISRCLYTEIVLLMYHYPDEHCPCEQISFYNQ